MSLRRQIEPAEGAVTAPQKNSVEEKVRNAHETSRSAALAGPSVRNSRGGKLTALLLVLSASFLLGGCPQRLEIPLEKEARERAKLVDFDTLRQYAEMAAMAYKSKAAIQRRYGAGTVVEEEKKKFGLFFLLTDLQLRAQTVAIRGTDTPFDLIKDIRIKKRKWNGISFHEGFQSATDKMLSKLRPHLKRENGDAPYKLRLIGHSLGGAMAVILHMKLVTEGYDRDRIETFTFGQPKVTDLSGSVSYSGFKITRVVNDRDSIPRYPPRHEKKDYYNHVGPAVILWDRGTEWSFVLESQAKLRSRRDTLNNRPKFRLRYHGIKNYVERLKRGKGMLVPCCRT